MLCKKETGEGFPWQSSGWDAVLLMQGVQVRALIEELRSHMPQSTPPKMCKHFSQCLFNTRYSINVRLFFFLMKETGEQEGGLEILRWKLAIGYSISWGESEKVRFEQRLEGGEGFHLLLSGEMCFWLRKELKQSL